MAHMLRLAVINRYQPKRMTCTDFGGRGRNAGRRRSSSSSAARKATPERRLMVETRFLRKPGQSDIDP